MHPRALLNAALLERYGDDEAAVILGAPLSIDEWVSVSGAAMNLAAGDRTRLERILRRIVNGRRTYLLPRRRETRDGVPTPPTERGAAVATLLVTRMLAAEDPCGVVGFRRDVLGGDLCTPQAIGPWIDQQPRSTGLTGRTLAYRIPTSEWTHHVGTRMGGTLERLRGTSERVAAFTGWTAGDATVFVLSGEVPAPSAVRAEVRYTATMSVRSRIVLTIDPTSTPAEVAAAYRRLRLGNFGRVRRLSAKHTALAHFALEHGHLAAREQMTLWNARRRTLKYPQLKQFTRDRDQAVRRLENPLRPPKFP